MSGGQGATVQVGTAEVAVRANLGPLEQGLEQARRATQQFQQATNQTANAIQGGFNRAVQGSASAAQTFTQSTQQSATVATTFNTSLARAAVTARQFQTSVAQFNTTNQQMAATITQFNASVNQLTQSLANLGNQQNRNNRTNSTFRQNVTQAAGAIGLIPGPAGAAASRIASLLITMEGLSTRGIIIGGTIGALVLAFSKAAKEAEAFERQTLRLEGVLRATEHAAGLTTEQINNFAEELEVSTLATSESIKEAAEALATFGSVSGDEFKRTIALAQDMAGRFGGIVNATEALGRAFERPAEAARLFRRIGLHELVLKQAQAMQDAGKEAESYAFILDEVSKKVKGVGEFEAEGVTGSWHRLTDAAGDFFRLLGQQTHILDLIEGTLDLATFTVEGFTFALKEAGEAWEHLQELVDDPLGIDNPATKLPFAGDDTQKIFAEGMAKAALARKKANDQALKDLEAQQKAAKDLAEELQRLAKAEKDRLDQLEVQREAALEAALIEVSITERLLPELLKSNQSRTQINKTIADRIALEKQLSDLGLKETSVDAQRLISAKLIRDIDAALIDAVGAEDEFHKSQLNVNEALREFNVQINEISQETVLIGHPETIQAAAQFSAQLREMIEELKRTGVNTELLERNFDDLIRRFSEVDALNRSTQLLSEMVDEIDALNRELDIQTFTFGKTTGEAARYRFEQEALARQIDLTGEISAEQALDIKQLSIQYGAAAQAMADFHSRQEAAHFVASSFVDTLRELADGTKSFGDAALDLANTLADAVTQAALLGEGPLAGIFGTAGTGGLFGGALTDLFGGGAEAGAASAEAAAMTAATTQLSTAGISLNTAGGALSGAAAALSTAATALGAAGAADAGEGLAEAASAAASVFHGGGEVGASSIKRRVPIASVIRAPRYHNGLRQDERVAVLQTGEEVNSREEVKRRRGRGGDTYIVNVPGVTNTTEFKNSQPQIAAAWADQAMIARRRNR